MLGPAPHEQPGRKNSRLEVTASGEIENGRGVEMREAEKRREMQDELAGVIENIGRIGQEIMKLEAATKAVPTDRERSAMDQKIEEARRTAMKTFGNDSEMVDRFIDATRKTFLEGREGLDVKLQRARQRMADLSDERELLESRLRGGSSAS